MGMGAKKTKSAAGLDCASPQWWQSAALGVVVLWLIVSALLAGIGFGVGTQTILPGPASYEALLRNPGERLALKHGIPPTDTVLLVISLGNDASSAPKARIAVDALIAMLQGASRSSGKGPLFSRIMTSGRTWFNDEDSLFVSKSARHQVIRARTTVPLYEAATESAALGSVVQQWREQYPAYSVNVISSGNADDEIFELIHRDLDHSLLYTLPLTLLVLVWAFGSIGAALIPLGVALVSLVSSLGLSAIISHVTGPISATANQLVVLLVLAVGVDYSLFLVSRVREELGHGAQYPEAVRRSRASAGVAVCWSGVTVALSLSGLILMRDTVLTSMALVAILAVIVTVAGSVLALPSLLLLVEPWVRPKKSAKSSEQSHWSVVAASVQRPLVTLLMASVPLLLLAAVAAQVRLGSTMERHLLPLTMQTASAFHLLQKEFPEQAGSDLSLVVKWNRASSLDADETLAPFFDAFRRVGHVQGPFEVDHSADGAVSRYRFAVQGTANDATNHELLHRARQRLVPELLAPLGIEAFFSGNVPYVVDETERYVSRTPEVLVVVLLTSMLFLLLAFRSLVVPIKALILNALSTAASFGILVVVFQWGVVPEWQYGVIEGFVPALLFAILFGLSMDYHVFLLSRIQEEAQAGAATAVAIQRAVHATFRTITSAALIMACVFGIIACLELPIMKQLGVGLAVAVVIDATIIRSLLLPASMVLLGKLNWYLPRCLAWLPRIGK